MNLEEAKKIAEKMPDSGINRVNVSGYFVQGNASRQYTDEDKSAFSVLGICEIVVAFMAIISILVSVLACGVLGKFGLFLAIAGIALTAFLWFISHGIICYLSGIYRNIAELNGKRKE